MRFGIGARRYFLSRRDRRTQGARGTGRTVALPGVIEGVAARLRLGLVGRYRRHRPSLEPDCSLLAPALRRLECEPGAIGSQLCLRGALPPFRPWLDRRARRWADRDLHAPDWLGSTTREVTSNPKGASRHSSVLPWRRPRASSRARAARAPASGPPPALPRGSSRPRRPRTVSDAHRASTCFIFAIRTRRGHRRRSPRTNR